LQFLTNRYLVGVIVAAFVVTAITFTAVAVGIESGWRAYTVQGGSMQPEYDQGDLIVTSTVDTASVQPGQIIVFTADWASERYAHRVVHRVSAIGEVDGQPVAYTRGDANTVSDPAPVNLNGDVRVVRFTIAQGGLWAEMLTGPFMVISLVTLGAAMIGAVLFAWLPLFNTGLRQVRRVPQTRTVSQTGDLRFPY
jgi:signal peptidase I